ncbi:MAG: citrate synthase [Planctomycetota bacterium]
MPENTAPPAPKPDLVPGLAGIPAAESAISFIDGNQGLLAYRGHPIESLSEKSNFEETAWLLLYGKLPSRAELDSFSATLAEMRQLPERMIEILRALPGSGHPMDALQASMASFGMFSRHQNFRDTEYSDEAIMRILGAMPVLVAAFDRIRGGKDVIEPDPSLGTAANFLWMLTGHKPSELEARILDVALILHADHTMNASTFAARVVASTEADPYTVVSSAIGALTGPLHGGANERVLEQLREIGEADSVEAWVDGQVTAKRKIMGFGHRVYKVKDPRADILQSLANNLFESHGHTPIYDTAVNLEDEVVKRLGDKGIHPNVDFYSGIVYSKLSIPIDLFTPIFAIARTAGWLAHWREQMASNRIFRPTQIYSGEHEQRYVPIESR